MKGKLVVMRPIIIQGSVIIKKGCDSLDSKRACNEICGGPGSVQQSARFAAAFRPSVRQPK